MSKGSNFEHEAAQQIGGRRRVRVLIVDDSQAVLDALGKWFRAFKIGEVVATALSASGALDIVARMEVDVLLLDVRMPGRTGLQVVENVKRLAPNLRVILMSHYPFDKDELARVSGIDACLAKDDLSDRLPSLLKEYDPR